MLPSSRPAGPAPARRTRGSIRLYTASISLLLLAAAALSLPPSPQEFSLSHPESARSGVGRAGEMSSAAVRAQAAAVGHPGLSRHLDPSCSGTGVDGNRVQILYVHEVSTPSRYEELLPAMRDVAAGVDDLLGVSARVTGGGRRVRWVHDGAEPSCVPTVLEVSVPDDAFEQTFGYPALVRLGFNRPDRKYLMFAEASEMCGISTTYDDSRRTGNKNDGFERKSSWARLDLPCWGAFPAAHEVMHFLGAVQSDAAHATGLAHCWDGRDIMCYDDSGPSVPPGGVVERCGAAEALFDCGSDDYFSLAPPANSYLATRWNTADSSFLDAVPVLAPAPTLQIQGPRTLPRGTPTRFEGAGSLPAGTTLRWEADSPDCTLVPEGALRVLLRCTGSAGEEDPARVLRGVAVTPDGQQVKAEISLILTAPPPQVRTSAVGRSITAVLTQDDLPIPGAQLTLEYRAVIRPGLWRTISQHTTDGTGTVTLRAERRGHYRVRLTGGARQAVSVPVRIR